jgi:hypothetical protein
VARQKRSVGGRVTIDGADYIWSLRREPQWYPPLKAWVGVVITVEPAEDPQKLLIIEYPMPENWKGMGPMGHRMPRPAIDSSDFANQIARALAAGWDPGSRGKPFVFDVETGQRL